MKIMLLNPSTLQSSMKKSFSGIERKFQPLGISYIASFLKSRGKDVMLIDADLHRYTEERLKVELMNYNPDLVAITSCTATYNAAKKSAQLIKDIFSETIVVLGGTHASIFPKEVLEDCNAIDYVVVGEGEITMLELINSLERNSGIENVRGLAYKIQNTYHYNGNRSLIADLDTLPFVERIPAEIGLYKPTVGNYKSLPVATMISGRGCPFNCTFCDKSIFGRSCHTRSAKNVVDELEYVNKTLHVNDFIFFDDLFTVNKKRVIEICTEICKRGLDIDWTCESRVDTIDDEMLRALKRAGCWQVSFGIESGNQDILDLIKKDTPLVEIEEAIRITKANGLKARAYFILGFPGDTVESIRETIEFAKKVKLDSAIFSYYTPYAGTPLFDIAQKHGKIIVKDWSGYTNLGDEPPYIPDGLTSEKLKELMKEAYKSFYFNCGFIIKHATKIRSVGELKESLNGLLAVIRQ